MQDLQKIIDIARDINAESETKELEYIKNRQERGAADIVIPLIGEFSSGKTTLINALTDSRVLETATKPTTATIYEIHFGSGDFHASYMDKSGKITEIKDAEGLKNDVLADAVVVNIFDKSTKVPASTILVDTPGLSSPVPEHRQTLVDFLPQADAILLVVDINQQITRSLTDFIETMQLSHRPIYLVLTKSDTKADTEVPSIKDYIGKNCKIPLKNVVCVSANNGKLDELYALFATIQKKKDEIIAEADKQRVKRIVNSLQSRIDELLKSTKSDSGIDEAIHEKEIELNKVQNAIRRLMEDARMDIEDEGRKVTREFEDTIFTRLEALISGKNKNFDAEAVSIINSTASLKLSDIKTGIARILQSRIEDYNRDKEPQISLAGLDLSSLAIEGLSYNLDLNSAGHEYDGRIATGLKVGAVAAAVIVGVGAMAGAAGTATAAGTAAEGAAAVGAAAAEGATAASGIATAMEVGTIASVADTATDVASIVANKKMAQRMMQAAAYAQAGSKQLEAVNKFDQEAGGRVGSNKGLVEGIVGLATEELMGKPQRRRIINDYLANELLPQFKNSMIKVIDTTQTLLATCLNDEIAQATEEQISNLAELKKQRSEAKASFDARLSQLRDYNNVLVTL